MKFIGYTILLFFTIALLSRIFIYQKALNASGTWKYENNISENNIARDYMAEKWVEDKPDNDAPKQLTRIEKSKILGPRLEISELFIDPKFTFSNDDMGKGSMKIQRILQSGLKDELELNFYYSVWPPLYNNKLIKLFCTVNDYSYSNNQNKKINFERKYYSLNPEEHYFSSNLEDLKMITFDDVNGFRGENFVLFITKYDNHFLDIEGIGKFYQ